MTNLNYTTRCGYIAIVGRPNVGKSTLLNRLLGEKLSITSRKAQTTRHKVLGITSQANVQCIYVDTPGLHQAEKTGLNQYMNRTANLALQEVDVAVWVIDASRWTEDDDWILGKLKSLSLPIILALNKVDKLADKSKLLAQLQRLSEQLTVVALIPLSAKTGKNVPLLAEKVTEFLPVGPFLFPEDELTDRSQRFLAAEFIREKIMRYLGQELPYSMTVEIEQFKEESKLLRIHAIIWIEKANHKAILIGKEGEHLKKIGQLARLDMEKRFEQKVFLKLWIKVKKGWSNDERALRSLGYD